MTQPNKGIRRQETHHTIAIKEIRKWVIALELVAPKKGKIYWSTTEEGVKNVYAWITIKYDEYEDAVKYYNQFKGY